MSEYQYYEFQAIDRPLGDADRQALRDISTRARITATRFTNSYEWGDFKGDPAQLMERWFDLHLYLANWGSRRLMIRMPKRLSNQPRLDGFLRDVDCAELRSAGENLILDIQCEEIDGDDDDWGEDSRWLAALAPLRADVLAGDHRLFYLLWLTAVEAEAVEADELEPLPGIGPMTAALEAFVDFFDLDGDLIEAAAERPVDACAASTGAAREAIAAMTDGEKTDLLARLFDGEPHVAAELKTVVRGRLAAKTGVSPPVARTAGDLRVRAQAIRAARERAAAEKAAAEQRRQAAEAEKARRARLKAVAARGDDVWREIESEIERRNASGYDRATSLLLDLRTVAEERGATGAFNRQFQAIRERHVSKPRFIGRLAAMG